MRKPLIAGNWKLHNTVQQSEQLARDVIEQIGQTEEIEIVIAPVFTALAAVNTICKNSNIQLAAQNCHCIDSGAYTGEVSAPLLADVGCSHVIIGHSERRQYFGETNQFINAKTKAVINTDLTAIICVGETLEQRESGELFDVIASQVKSALADITATQMAQVVLAYEPIWAIGTGKTASSEDAEEVHAYIRGILYGLYGASIADKCRILYGGSVKPNNISELMAEDDIDGALVGGASLSADDFAAIVRYKKTLKISPQ
ncbi:MAG: triose-phosphate isomerase [Desulfuromonas sp.]|nr:triose-phosphate isomerase [Desulfuromonas sp.]